MAPFNSIPARKPPTAFGVIYFRKILPGFKSVKFIHIHARQCEPRKFIGDLLTVCFPFTHIYVDSTDIMRISYNNIFGSAYINDIDYILQRAQ